MSNNKRSYAIPYFKISLLSSLIAMSITGVNAQENIVPKKKVVQEKKEDMEVIEVTGIKASMADAVLTKRNSNIISDGISADGLSDFPDLNLAEALQRVTGVQLNRQDRGRTGTILIRGLPQTFSLVTFNGQTIAPPQFSNNENQGSGFPLGMLRSDIISKGNVYKTMTAEMNTGGLSGIVDLQSTMPLEKGNKGGASIDFRYDELTKTTSPGGGLSFSRKFSDDTFGEYGFAFGGGYEKLNFGRHVVRINRWDTETVGGDIIGAANGVNITEGVNYYVPAELRLSNEIFKGFRSSGSLSFQWQPNDNWDLSLSGVYGTQEVENYSETQKIRSLGHSEYIVNSNPIGGGVDAEGNELHKTIEDVTLVDPQFYYGKREYIDRHETFAIRGHAKWNNGDRLTIDGGVNTTQGEMNRPAAAMYFFSNRAIENEFKNKNLFDLSTAGGLNNFTAQQTAGVNVAELMVGLIDSSGLYRRTTHTRNVRFYDNGQFADGTDRRDDTFQINTFDRSQLQENSEDSIDLNFTYDTIDLLGIISEVKVGAKYRDITASQDSMIVEQLGLPNFENVTSDFISRPDMTSDFMQGAGNISTDGWYVPDVKKYFKQAGPCDAQIAIDEGYEDATCGLHGAPQFREGDSYNYIFDIDRSITALYAMANFDTDLGDIPISGNFGVRYVEFDRTSRGYNFSSRSETDDRQDANSAVETINSHKFDDFLPSFNIKFELDYDLVIRAAYSKAMVAPNPRDFSAGIVANEKALDPENDREDSLNPRLRYELGNFNVDPFSANNFDISLEWYNREGTLFSVGIFQKDITGQPKNINICPEDARNPQTGELFNLEITGLETLAGGGNNGEDICVATTLPENFPLIDPATGEATVMEVQIKDTHIIDYSIRGLEFSAVQNLDFLPAPFNNMGVNANYTQIEQVKGDVKLLQTSKHSANMILWYEDGPFAMRGAYNYRSERELSSGSTIFGLNNRIVQARGVFDARLSYKITKDIKVQFDVFNISSEPIVLREGDIARLREYQDRGRTYKLSARMRF